MTYYGGRFEFIAVMRPLIGCLRANGRVVARVYDKRRQRVASPTYFDINSSYPRDL